MWGLEGTPNLRSVLPPSIAEGGCGVLRYPRLCRTQRTHNEWPYRLAFPGEPDYRDSPLLDAIRQGSSAAHGRLRDSLSVASDKALLQAAADSLPEVARGCPEEVPDALR